MKKGLWMKAALLSVAATVFQFGLSGCIQGLGNRAIVAVLFD